MQKSIFQGVSSFALKWTPRIIAVGIGGYYGLGLAYELGIMATIDKIAIVIFKSIVGRAGIGVFMPTFQWYSAVFIRGAAAICSGIIYEISNRIFIRCLAVRPT